MKKSLSILAIAAVVLGMASCNNEDVNLKRFQLAVDNITATSAHIVITPPDEQMAYSYFLFNEATYNWYKAQEDGVKSALALFVHSQGTNDDTWENIYPNSKYVLCVGEKDTVKGTIVGDVEYIRFRTPAKEAKLPDFIEEGQEHLEMTGEYATIADGRIVSISGKYPIPEGNGQTMNLYLYFVSDKSTGHFTTDDLFSYVFVVSSISIDDSEGKTLEGYAVCGADLQGTYNATTGKNEYKGTVDFRTKDDGLFRLPVFLQCTK